MSPLPMDEDAQYFAETTPTDVDQSAAAAAKSVRRGRKISRKSSIMKTITDRLQLAAEATPPSVMPGARSMSNSPVLAPQNDQATSLQLVPASLLANVSNIFEHPAAIDVPLFAALASGTLTFADAARHAQRGEFPQTSFMPPTSSVNITSESMAAAVEPIPSPSWPASHFDAMSVNASPFGLQPLFMAPRERTHSFASASTASSSTASSICGPSTPDTFSPSIMPATTFGPDMITNNLFGPMPPQRGDVVLDKLDGLWSSFSKLDDSLDLFAVPASAQRQAVTRPKLDNIDDLAPWIDLSQAVSTSTWLELTTVNSEFSDLFGLS
ncbi:hypothetical protein OIV83_003164 [Microbotryomycetes sp. JL201]|nr:hypothetical protein OIV83_003164 [Microbotryomycetes sp. JL201]